MSSAERRAAIEAGLHRVWSRRGPLAWVLWPLSLVHRVFLAALDATYRTGLLRPWRVGVPVVVVGNLYLGGTGKTPLAIELARGLTARGRKPGIVARGYGANPGDVRLVEPGARASDVGDEPLLMAQTLQGSGVPVVVGRDRVAACRILRSVHPRCDVIIADDGLQHRRLARDVELALLDDRGLGNGFLLPAGPLREPPTRLRRVQAAVCNGIVPPVRIYSPRYLMSTHLRGVRSLADPSRAISIDGLVEEQRRAKLKILAAAGIGAPRRFFAMLRDAGLEIEELSLPDHHDYATNPFLGRRFDLALITEKDAVKCREVSALATDGRMCVVSQQVSIDQGLIDFVLKLIAAPPADKPEHNDPTPHGPTAA